MDQRDLDKQMRELENRKAVATGAFIVCAVIVVCLTIVIGSL